jgi:hypothetical protein
LGILLPCLGILNFAAEKRAGAGLASAPRQVFER